MGPTITSADMKFLLMEMQLVKCISYTFLTRISYTSKEFQYTIDLKIKGMVREYII